MKRFDVVIGPRDLGPGERQEMLERARGLLATAGVDGIDRFDIPGRGGGEPDDGGALRPEVERLIPALQSGSLFGGKRGVLVVDAHHLLKAEAEAVAALAEAVDPETGGVVFVAESSLPEPLRSAAKEHGQVHQIKKLRERDAADWLGQMARRRNITLQPAAAAALVQRFGSDVAALGQALDQLATVKGPIAAEEVTARFRNRPDEPTWLYADAVAAGNVGEALRRLSDFLSHGHPLQLLAALEGDLRRRALAATAPSVEVLAEWLGSRPDHFPVTKAWRAREATSDDDMRRALQAVARADLALKSAPEATHRLTMERLTVALARWYRGR